MLLRKSKKVFIHLDCDSFFASCEILKNPLLRGKHVCVWEEIIVACTYNCKALWIKTWTPIWEAKKILRNNWFFLPGDHSYYEKISDEIFNYLEDSTLTLEPFSIDEAFCEITWLPELYKISLEWYLKNLQQNILKEIWIPVSIWCADTRIKAKIFSKINKPFWIYIWFDKEKEIALFKNLDIAKIPFIWKSHQNKLRSDAKSIYDFVWLWFWDLKNKIWKTATDLWLELVWVNAFIVKKSKEIKSMSRTRSFNHHINSDKNFLLLQLTLNFERLFEKLTEKNLEIKKIALLLRTKNFQTLIYELNLQEHTNNRNIIFSSLIKLFEYNYNEKFLYRSTWIIFNELRNYLPQQKNIFDWPLRWKENNYNLYKTIESINERYWSHKISFGTCLLWKWNDLKLELRKN